MEPNRGFPSLSKHGGLRDLTENAKMATGNVPRIVAAEQVGDALLITFANGDQGLYSGELLYASLPEASALLAAVLKAQEDGGNVPH
jgi:hypothetical protein